MFEGDIVLGKADELRAEMETEGAAFKALGIGGERFLWPKGQIPYEIEAGFPDPQRVTDAIAHWEANTRVRFIPRTKANAAQYPDYVQFVNGHGCSSFVGRQGGMQPVTLGGYCTTGNAIHELGHAIGLWHEQSREDRGAFVRIEWTNIEASAQHNFNQHISDGDDLGDYDFGSIMHYPVTAFSTNGKPTIVPTRSIPDGVVIGQRSALSAGDIAGVHMLYARQLPPA